MLTITPVTQPDGTTVCILTDADGNEYYRGHLTEVHQVRRQMEEKAEQEKRDAARQ